MKSRLAKLAIGLTLIVTVVLTVLMVRDYRFTPEAAAKVFYAGEVVERANAGWGIAMLIAHPNGTYNVGVACQWMGLWRTCGGSTITNSPQEQTPVSEVAYWSAEGSEGYLVFAGLVHDGKVTQVVAGSETKDARRHFLFLWRTKDPFAFAPAKALSKEGTILYEFSSSTDWRWK